MPRVSGTFFAARPLVQNSDLRRKEKRPERVLLQAVVDDFLSSAPLCLCGEKGSQLCYRKRTQLPL